MSLSPDNVKWANEVGTDRYVRSKKRGSSPRFSYESTGRSGEETHRMGARGELGFCVAYGLTWPARVDTFRELPDVDPCWEIRTTENMRQAKVTTDDAPDYLMAHVRQLGVTEYEIVGYIVAGWAQRNYPATDPGDRKRLAHFFPEDKLVPLYPDSHSACHWLRFRGDWFCMFCAATYP